MAKSLDTEQMAATANAINEQLGETVFSEPIELDTAFSPRFVRRTHEGMAEWFVEEFGDDVRYLFDLGKAKESEHFAVWDGQKWETSGWVMGMIAERMRTLTGRVRVAVREMLSVGDEQAPTIAEHQIEEKLAFLKAKKVIGEEERSFCAFSKEIQGQRFKNGWLSELKGYKELKAAFTEFDGDESKYYLNCANGVLDLRDGVLHPFTEAKRLKITKQISTAWDAQAVCPVFDEFLRRIFRCKDKDGREVPDEELIAYVWRALGYSLSGDVSEEAFFICWGTGGNGKGKLIGAISELLEAYAVSLPIATFIESKNQSGEAASPNMMRRRGARFTVLSETEDNAKLASGLLKLATGRDKVPARALFQNAIEFMPTDKLWFLVNEQPKINGLDQGMRRRLNLIPFTVTIPDNEIDKHLDQKLRAELPGVLRKAAEGFKQWVALGGLRAPKSVVDATNQYFDEQDTVAKFINEYCGSDADDDRKAGEFSPLSGRCGELWESYKRHFPDGLSANAFGRALTKKNYPLDERRTRRRGVWLKMGE
jgi:P4 family phage/plasmid primase-like protien